VSLLSVIIYYLLVLGISLIVLVFSDKRMRRAFIILLLFTFVILWILS